ncbi:branched-chain amino acid ABC transporter permease [Roseateles sp. GG27B]
MDPVLIENLLQRIVTGVLVGSIYGLLCTGLGMIFGVIRVINFAQGEFMMLGMYATLIIGGMLATFFGLGPALGAYMAIVVAALVLAGGGWCLQRFVISRVSGTRAAGSDNEGHFSQLILTLGLSLVLSNLALILFGSSPQTVKSSLSSSSWTLGPFTDGAITVFVNQARAIGCVFAVLVSAALYFFVQKTRAGTSMRAAADNPTAATIVGIDVESAYARAFAIGTGATALAGGLIAMYYPVHPYIGVEFVIIMYAGVVLGGMGSMLGAFWGGFTMGLMQQLSAYFMPFQLQNATIFILFLVVVLLRPQGLFGRSAERT